MDGLVEVPSSRNTWACRRATSSTWTWAHSPVDWEFATGPRYLVCLCREHLRAYVDRHRDSP
jgi:hypothetical protein